MIYSNLSWQKTSENKIHSFIFLDEEILKNNELIVSVKYFENILKKLGELSAFNYEVGIVIPDLYSFYNYHLMLLDDENENLAKKRIKNLHLFLSKASKLNTKFYFTLDFHSIASFSDVINRVDLNNFEVKENIDNHSSLKYNDLLYTQVIKLKKDNVENELYDHIHKIYTALSKYVEIKGFFISNLFEFCQNKQNQVGTDDYKFIVKTFQKVISSMHIDINIYESMNKAALYLHKKLQPLEIYTDIVLSSQFNEIVKNIETLYKKDLNVIFNSNKFLSTRTGSFSYKDTQVRIILENLSVSSRNYCYYFAFENKEDQWKVNLFDYLLLQDNINGYFISTLYKRHDILHYNNPGNSVKIVSYCFRSNTYKHIFTGDSEFKFSFRYQNIRQHIKIMWKKIHKEVHSYGYKWNRIK
ncbi:hypothetical protein ACNQ2O_01830 [Mycoplasma sp. AA7A]|uniref:hypothetical protein n=1 Tax=unclassified Mycoplasma TaxID=2683645 RepID=UPI003AACF83E